MDIGGPDYEITLAEFELQLSQQETNIKSITLRRKQLMSELARIDYNEKAAQAAIAEIQTKINECLASKSASGN